MIRDVIIPNNNLFAVLVRVGMSQTNIEQYNTLAEYWYLRFKGIPAGQDTYNSMSSTKDR